MRPQNLPTGFIALTIPDPISPEFAYLRASSVVRVAQGINCTVVTLSTGADILVRESIEEVFDKMSYSELI